MAHNPPTDTQPTSQSRDLVLSAAHCVYVTDGGVRRCKTPAVGVYPRGHYPDWPLCAEHAQQKHHPADTDMSRFELRNGDPS